MADTPGSNHSKGRAASIAHDGNHASSGESPLSPLVQTPGWTTEKVKRCLDAYFDRAWCATASGGFLCRREVMAKLDAEALSPILLKTLLVLAAPFMDDGTPVPSQWTDDINYHIMAHLGSFSMRNLQVLILWSSYNYFTGQLGKTWMLHSLAARMAVALQINNPASSLHNTELARRMFWHIICTDRTLAGPFDDFLVLTVPDGLRLPCDEASYAAKRQVKCPTVSQVNAGEPMVNTGPMGATCILLGIWRDVLVFTRDLLRTKDIVAITTRAQSLRHRLCTFERQLPSNLQFNSRSLYLHASNAEQQTYVTLRTRWYECFCDLYRFSVPGFRESVATDDSQSAFTQSSRREILNALKGQSDFWREVMKSGCAVYDTSMMTFAQNNTRTWLSLQQLQRNGRWNSPDMPADFSDIFATNIAILDELAKCLPRVADAQNAIRHMISRGDSNISAEHIIEGGLPLKRRHSRQEERSDKRIQLLAPQFQELPAQTGATMQLPAYQPPPPSATALTAESLSLDGNLATWTGVLERERSKADMYTGFDFVGSSPGTDTTPPGPFDPWKAWGDFTVQ